MCIGVPMQVVECHEFHAICSDGAEQHKVDTLLVGAVEPGTWLLVFLGAAREVLDPDTALQMRDAVSAVGHVMSGNLDVQHLFADINDREPQVPEHLKHLIKEA